MKQFMKTHAGRVEEPGCNLHDVSSPISTAAVHVTVCPKTNWPSKKYWIGFKWDSTDPHTAHTRTGELVPGGTTGTCKV